MTGFSHGLGRWWVRWWASRSGVWAVMMIQVQRSGIDGCADTRSGPAQSVFEEPEGVFGVEAAQEGSPQAVQVRVGELGPGVGQPDRCGAAITGERVHVEPG